MSRFTVSRAVVGFLAIVVAGPVFADGARSRFRCKPSPPPRVVMYDQPTSAAGSVRSPVAQQALPSYGIKPVKQLQPLDMRIPSKTSASEVSQQPPKDDSSCGDAYSVRRYSKYRNGNYLVDTRERKLSSTKVVYERETTESPMVITGMTFPQTSSRERYVEITLSNPTDGFLLFDENTFLGVFDGNDSSTPSNVQTLKINGKPATRYERVIPAKGQATIRLAWDHPAQAVPTDVFLR